MQYSLVGTDDGGSNITVFVKGGSPLQAHSSHPNWDAILKGVFAGDDKVADLFDISIAVGGKFKKLTERVSVAHGMLFFDGDEVNDAVATQVVRFLNEDVEDWKPLVAFMENVQQNPNEHSREQLYDWLDKRDFTITDDGLIVGYKGVENVTEGGFQSMYQGTATVNGVTQNGKIKQNLGDVVEMPRSAVAHDPAAACHSGLHVGTFEFARGFSRGTVLEVHVNPRDIVSVPSDSNSAKVRCCRYTVIKPIEVGYTDPVVYGNFDEDDCCPVCGEEDCYYCDEDLTEDVEEEVAEEEITEEESSSVNVGDTFENNDKRRQGTSFKVESIEGDHAVGKSLPNNLTRKVRLDRLDSYRYTKV